MAKYRPTRTEQNRLIKNLLWINQGEKCKICKKDKIETEGIIEHHNGDNADYSPDNIGFVCYSCNQRKRPDYCQQGSLSSGKSVCVNTGAETTDSDSFRDRNRIKKASPEIEINRDSEPIVRRYLWENIARDGGLIVDDTINESAEKADCSPVTSRRHIMKACSLAGPFKIGERLPDKKEIIILREEYNPDVRSRLGRLDYGIVQERIKRMEEIQRIKERELSEKLQTVEDAIKVQSGSLSRVANERDSLKSYLKDKGLTEKEIEEIVRPNQQVRLPCILCGNPFSTNEKGCSITGQVGTCGKCMSKGASS